MNNLKKRFLEHSAIYTNVGNILISINPYKDLNLYGTDNIRKYFNRKNDANVTLPPHVFDIAYASLYGLKYFQKSQSIVISGESGAGKTEATKQCLNFIAANAGSKSKVEQKILNDTHVTALWAIKGAAHYRKMVTMEEETRAS